MRKKERVTTTAAYDGRCPECGGGIDEGDTIVKDEQEDQWVCEECGMWLP